MGTVLGNVRSHSGVCMVGGGCPALQCFSKTLCGVNIPTTGGFKLPTAKHLAQKKTEKKMNSLALMSVSKLTGKGDQRGQVQLYTQYSSVGCRKGLPHTLSPFARKQLFTGF